MEVEDWEWEDWEEEEEDESDAESVATTVRALKTISAATIIANSAGQGASGRGGSARSLLRPCGRRGCCNMFQIVLFVDFFVSLPGLTTAAPHNDHGGRLGLSRPQTTYCMCSFIQMMFFFWFCFCCLVCVHVGKVVCHHSGYYDPASGELWWFHPPSGDCAWGYNTV